MIKEFGQPMPLPPINFTLSLAFENIQLTWDSPIGKGLMDWFFDPCCYQWARLCSYFFGIVGTNKS
jgi:hypothetical protein